VVARRPAREPHGATPHLADLVFRSLRVPRSCSASTPAASTASTPGPAAMTSLFGGFGTPAAATPAAAPAGGTSLFGTPVAATPASTGLFGSTGVTSLGLTGLSSSALLRYPAPNSRRRTH